MTEPFSLVIPTLNESESLPRLVESLDCLLDAGPQIRLSELIVVDDGSTDGTREYVQSLQALTKRYSVRLEVRSTRHGPANAELHGIKIATNDVVLKLDADGQHSVDVIPSIINSMDSQTDLVIASRYVKGGRNNWQPVRGLISRGALSLSQLALPAARPLTDPISGYFGLRKRLAQHLDPRYPRFKLVLYLIAMNPCARIREVPMEMGRRNYGKSKVVDLSSGYVVDYLRELVTYWKEARRSSPEAHRETVIQEPMVTDGVRDYASDTTSN